MVICSAASGIASGLWQGGPDLLSNLSVMRAAVEAEALEGGVERASPWGEGGVSFRPPGTGELSWRLGAGRCACCSRFLGCRFAWTDRRLLMTWRTRSWAFTTAEGGGMEGVVFSGQTDRACGFRAGFLCAALLPTSWRFPPTETGFRAGISVRRAFANTRSVRAPSQPSSPSINSHLQTPPC
jgi:hypothetical protein